MFQFKFNGALVVSTHRACVPPKVMEVETHVILRYGTEVWQIRS